MTAADEHDHGNETHDAAASIPLHAEAVHDPPPPYPTPRRSRRARRVHATASHHQQLSSGAEADETTPFLQPPSPHPQHRRPSDGEQRHTRTRSDSSGSMWSTISGSPSLAQTVFTFFDDVDVDSEDEECGEPHLRRRDHFPAAEATTEGVDGRVLVDGQTGPHRPNWTTKIHRYFRPLRKKVYYMSLVHLLLVNFPMALIAWVSLFVLTLLGTTLLMVLPLGLLLCFIDLLFARLLSRFELHLQTKFHFPSASLRRKPPIFVRPRAQPTDEETPLVQPTPNLTSTHLPPVHNVLLDETSFYKNTYAMFSDPTSYHALFYFLVIKPPITLLFSLFLVVIIVPLLVGIVTAPAALRLVRRMGVWQAAVAVEGLAGEA